MLFDSQSSGRKGFLGPEVAQNALEPPAFAPARHPDAGAENSLVAARAASPHPLNDLDLPKDAPPTQEFFSAITARMALLMLVGAARLSVLGPLPQSGVPKPAHSCLTHF